MEIHTYRAASLQEALMLVRHELGPEASVLQTREVAGKFFGLLGKRTIEVHASRDATVVRRLATTGSSAGAGQEGHDSNDDPHSAREGAAGYAVGASAGFDLTEESSAIVQHLPLHSDALEEDIDNRAHTAALKTQPRRSALVAGQQTSYSTNQPHPSPVVSAATAPGATSGSGLGYLSPAMFEVFTEMLDADVDPDAARVMLQEVAAHCTPDQLNDAWLIKGRLCQIIQQKINVSGPIDLSGGTRHVVALVGPTGVGKTTTLAKLAAGFHFDQGTSVGFVTLDTFRLGAVDQLQKYADLLGAPCEVVSAPDQMLPALDRLSHCQLILIDTAGRSPRDESQLNALNDFLRVAAPSQIHLVLSAASAQSHAQMAVEQFAAVRPTHLLLTKLDESTCLGSWYRLLSSGAWPLSYLTTGQHVPQDILVANRRRVASLILGHSNHLTWQ